MTAATLSRADLEAFDPKGGRGGMNPRYHCPFCSSGTGAKRNLSLHRETGEWQCHKCQEKGLLADFRPERPEAKSGRKERTARALRAMAGDAPPPVHRKSTTPPVAPTYDFAAEMAKVERLANGKGAGYLSSRGLDPAECHRAGVRYTSDLWGRACVVFPLKNGEGQLSGAQFRLVDGRDFGDGATKRTLNHPDRGGMGVFATPGAWESDAVAIVEAPIDALSLAACGVPALAMQGTSCPAWVVDRLAFRRVYLAHDADAGGQAAVDRWASELRKVGGSPHRLAPPQGSKDWNEALMTHGADTLRPVLAAAVPQAGATEVSRRLENPPSGDPMTFLYVEKIEGSTAESAEGGEKGTHTVVGIPTTVPGVGSPVSGDQTDTDKGASQCEPPSQLTTWRNGIEAIYRRVAPIASTQPAAAAVIGLLRAFDEACDEGEDQARAWILEHGEALRVGTAAIDDTGTACHVTHGTDYAGRHVETWTVGAPGSADSSPSEPPGGHSKHAEGVRTARIAPERPESAILVYEASAGYIEFPYPRPVVIAEKP